MEATTAVREKDRKTATAGEITLAICSNRDSKILQTLKTTTQISTTDEHCPQIFPP